MYRLRVSKKMKISVDNLKMILNHTNMCISYIIKNVKKREYFLLNCEKMEKKT